MVQMDQTGILPVFPVRGPCLGPLSSKGFRKMLILLVANRLKMLLLPAHQPNPLLSPDLVRGWGSLRNRTARKVRLFFILVAFLSVLNYRFCSFIYFSCKQNQIQSQRKRQALKRSLCLTIRCKMLLSIWQVWFTKTSIDDLYVFTCLLFWLLTLIFLQVLLSSQWRQEILKEA